MDENKPLPLDLTATESVDQGKQVALLERLQTLWLKRMETLIESGACTSTDMATLYRALRDNGWSLDPSKLPKGLADKLTSVVNAQDFEDEESNVLPFPKAAAK